MGTDYVCIVLLLKACEVAIRWVHKMHIQLELMTRQCARPYKEYAAFNHNYTKHNATSLEQVQTLVGLTGTEVEMT